MAEQQGTKEKRAGITYASKFGTIYVPTHQVPAQVCSAVDERKTRRHEDIRMTQRRHKHIATTRWKASGAPKKTVR